MELSFNPQVSGKGCWLAFVDVPYQYCLLVVYLSVLHPEGDTRDSLDELSSNQNKITQAY